jgi:cytochrome c oxidase cbb3-type subunit I
MQADVTARHSILSDQDDRSLALVFSAYVVSATLWLLFATGIGLLMAFKFGAPEFGTGAWLTFGRLRPIHTNATFFGFASIALVGLGYCVAARSSGAKLYSAALAWTLPKLLNRWFTPALRG